jgi:hypothetical protein
MPQPNDTPNTDPMRLEDDFYCRARRRRVTLDKCLNDYLDANAFSQRRSACWRCPQGRRNRECFALR